MEQKKLTRDQALIKLLRESVEKDNKIRGLDNTIKGLEKDKKNTEKRLKKLEEDFKRLSRLLADSDKTARVLKEKSSSLEHEINSVKHVLKRNG
jgi:wobble nucleotide-excising tRNase